MAKREKRIEALRRNPRTVHPEELDVVMALPYRIELISGETAWVASIPDLPGCLSQGRTPEDALEHIKEARELWIEGAIRDGLPIPTPSSEKV